MFLGEASRKIHREMKLGTSNVRSFYRAGSFKARRWDVGMRTGLGVAQDRARWRPLVSAAMNLRGSVKCGEFLD